MSSMESVIRFILCNNLSGASNAFSEFTGMSFDRSGKAVEALQPYLGPSYQKTAEASPEAPETILVPTSEFSPEDFKGYPQATAEPQEAKPEINKWMVTAFSPDGNENWQCKYKSEQDAVRVAKSLCAQNYRDVRISRVIAEAKAEEVTTTTWSIDL